LEFHIRLSGLSKSTDGLLRHSNVFAVFENANTVFWDAGNHGARLTLSAGERYQWRRRKRLLQNMVYPGHYRKGATKSGNWNWGK
jgi:hypothetical protein